ncbi:4a-hydroxytetrahydrobiopterin dehydratase [Mycolicibacterium litorale]|nr:4a-hydroxytetrahydrobiopterin dehydratase [Mycolicibacterium litorale]
MPLLTDEQVKAAVDDLAGWDYSEGALRRCVTFGSFLDGIDAVRRVADLAEQRDHHPDIDIRWRTVCFALVTHSEGGVTDKDVQLASEINHVINGVLGDR